MASEEQFDDRFVQEADLERVEGDAARAARQTQERAELDLMAAWVAGDRNAGNLLVRAYLKPITRFFQSKVRDSTRVEQLMSDFLEQLTRAPKQVHTTVKAYVFGIAKFTLFRYFRERQGNREDLMGSTFTALDAPESSFLANQRVETRLVLRALRKIELRRAMALEMHYFEGMSGREIAEILDAPEGTVRGLLRLGLVDLQREILAQERDPQVLAASQGTYTWLAGLVRYIEALRSRDR
jgi:RNA polymerase sigma-70 factor (ECF subfamily)